MADSLATARAKKSCHAIQYAASFYTDVLCLCNTISIMQQNSPQKNIFVSASETRCLHNKNYACDQSTSLLLKIFHRRHSHLGQFSRKTKAKHGQKRKRKRNKQPVPVHILPSLWSLPWEECWSSSISACSQQQLLSFP